MGRSRGRSGWLPKWSMGVCLCSTSAFLCRGARGARGGAPACRRPPQAGAPPGASRRMPFGPPERAVRERGGGRFASQYGPFGNGGWPQCPICQYLFPTSHAPIRPAVRLRPLPVGLPAAAMPATGALPHSPATPFWQPPRHKNSQLFCCQSQKHYLCMMQAVSDGGGGGNDPGGLPARLMRVDGRQHRP